MIAYDSARVDMPSYSLSFQKVYEVVLQNYV